MSFSSSDRGKHHRARAALVALLLLTGLLIIQALRGSRVPDSSPALPLSPSQLSNLNEREQPTAPRATDSTEAATNPSEAGLEQQVLARRPARKTSLPLPAAQPAPSAPKGAASNRPSPAAEELARLIRVEDKPAGPLGTRVDSRLIPVLEYLRAHEATDDQARRTLDADGAAALHSVWGAILAPTERTDLLAVRITAPVDPALLARLEQAGLGIRHAAPRWNTVEGLASLSAIDRMERMEGVRFISLQDGRRLRRSGAAYNQASGSMQADLARAQFGVSGAGQTVGVLSDTVNRVIGGTIDASGNLVGSASQVSADLPPTVRVLDPGPNDGSGTDEGAGMLELVHDVAPGAALAFASAFNSETSFADNITALRTTAGCTLTCDDVSWFDEPMFQDGPIAQAIEGNVAAGVPHFSAAGNDADTGIAATFVDIDPGTDNTRTNPNGVDFHDWGIGGTTPSFLPITLSPGAHFIAILGWNQPYASWNLGSGSESDLDEILYASASSSSTKLASSRKAQGDTGAPFGDPVEIMEYQNSGASSKTVYLALDHFHGVKTGVFFRIVFFIYADTVTFNTSVVNAPTIFGHTAAAGCNSVGAVYFGDIDLGGIKGPDSAHVNAEWFTSKGGLGSGGIPYYFDTSGNLLPSAPVFRDKPNLAAPDGGNTSFFGTDVPENPAGFETDPFPNFFGTSAAAPNAAAVAALVLERQPGLSPSGLRSLLTSTATDIVASTPLSGVGPDAYTGAGLVNALSVLAQTGPSALPLSVAGVTLAAPADPASVPKYGKVELLVSLAHVRAENFYDPDPSLAAGGLNLSATFTGPSGPQTVFGFYDGAAWRVRFAPRETGAWTYAVSAQDPSGSAAWSGGSFTCAASADPGFVRIDGRSLRFSEGQLFFPVGHNTGWLPDVEIPPLSDMKSRGENLLSFWLNAPWTLPAGTTAEQVAGTPAVLPDDLGPNRTPIENRVNGLGHYNQDACAYLDGVVQRAEQAGVYLLPSIWTHGQLRDPHHPWVTSGAEHYWYNNPYQVLGPAKDFFSTGANASQWSFQQKYYRYLLARWGYSRAIAGWVGLVEIDGTTGYGGLTGYSDVAKARTWCAAVRDYFRAHDPYRTNALNRCPLTVSKLNSPGFYTEISGGLDLVSSDSYAQQSSDLNVAQAIGSETITLRGAGVPALHAEFGGDVPNGATQPTHLHNGIWAGLSAGAAFTPLLWTDGFLSQGQHFPLLTELTNNQGALMRNHLEILAQFAGGLTCLGDPALVSGTATLSDAPSTRGWISKTTEQGFAWLQRTVAGTIGGQTLTISGLNPGLYQLDWFDAWSSGSAPFQTQSNVLANASGVLSVTVPALARQDLALRFAMTTESLDFGDAPESYHTLLAGNGPRHDVSSLRLGASIDYETNGVPSIAADGDDLAGSDDEDGVSGLSLPLVPSQNRSLTVTASGAGYLNAWVDFNRNGSFADPGEQIFADRALAAGSNLISFAVPLNAVPGQSYARFRLNSTGGLSITGRATNGEVEDYAVVLGETPFAWDVDQDGNWSEAAKWNPATVPNQPGGARYDVTIDRPSADPSVTLNQDAAINLLTLADRLVLPAGRTLTLTGYFTSTGTGVLSVELDGRAPAKWGQLNAAGSAQLAGTFEATLASGYVPAAGDSFQFLSCGSRTGTFNTLLGVNLPNGLWWDLQYSPTSVTLNVRQPSVTQVSITGETTGQQSSWTFQAQRTGIGSIYYRTWLQVSGIWVLHQDWSTDTTDAATLGGGSYQFKVEASVGSNGPAEASALGTPFIIPPDGKATHLAITGSSTQTAGAAQSLTLSALKDDGSLDPAYAGECFLIFSGANASPNPATPPAVMDEHGLAVAFGSPTAITFTAGQATVSGNANGVLKLYLAENALISVSDGTIGSSGDDRLSVTVAPGAASSLTAGGISDPITAGTASNLTVTLRDAYGNLATGYTGTVQLQSSDGIAVLPGAYSFTSGPGQDNGQHIFVGGVTLKTAGEQSVTVLDTFTPALTGAQAGITVQPTEATTVRVETAADGSGSLVPDQTLASGGSLTVHAVTRDAYGNYLGNPAAAWSLSSKTGGVQDADLAPTQAASAVFSATLAGSARIRATLGDLSSTESGILSVVAGTPASYRVTAETLTPLAGSDVTLMAQLIDQAGNAVATPAPRQVNWSLTGADGSLSAPSANTDAAGAAQVALTVGPAAGEEYTLTATDTPQGLTGTSPILTALSFSAGGGEGDGNLYVKKGALAINWSAHASGLNAVDRFSFSGNLNPAGCASNLAGVEVRVRINGADLMPLPLQLDSAGKAATPKGTTPAFRFALQSATGLYTFTASALNLTDPALGLALAPTDAGAVSKDLQVELLIEGAGLDTSAWSSVSRFACTAVSGASTKGKFAYAHNPTLSGVFQSLKTSAAQLAGGAIALNAGGPIRLPAGEALNPSGLLTIYLGEAAPILVPKEKLVASAGSTGTIWTYSPTAGGTPPVSHLQKLLIDNAKGLFSLSATGVTGSGLPLAGPTAETAHRMRIGLAVETAAGTKNFQTRVELKRALPTALKWKR